ncbi:MAG: DNA mismatch repair endonuclease MutL, partial [Nitrospinales bacterium]
ELVSVEKSNEDYRLEGYVSNPVYTRSNRSAQFFYINKRFIRDKVILHAIQHGFSHLLPRGRYPVLFLFLEMDPGLVDVNVHPAKAEVRFAYQQEVHRFVSEGIREGLTGNKQTSEPPLAREKRSTGDQGSSRQTINLPTDWKGRENPLLQNAPYPKEEHRDLSRAMDLFYKGPTGQPDPSSSTLPPQQMQSFDQKPLPVSGLIYSDFQTLGQLDNSFIIMQGKKGIVVVDQHIAHERVLYERFREAAKNKKVEVQQLLFPLAVEFTAGEAQLLNAHLDLLKDLGMELEPFGENGFLLRAVPAILKHDDHEEILREIVETLSSRGKVDSLQEKFDEVTIMMACRNAIKINQPMDKDQINKLIYDLEQTEMPYTCPHGRPISLFFDMEDILKKFLRK